MNWKRRLCLALAARRMTKPKGREPIGVAALLVVTEVASCAGMNIGTRGVGASGKKDGEHMDTIDRRTSTLHCLLCYRVRNCGAFVVVRGIR